MFPLQKPTDLDLHCLQRQGISGFSRTRVKNITNPCTLVLKCSGQTCQWKKKCSLHTGLVAAQHEHVLIKLKFDPSPKTQPPMPLALLLPQNLTNTTQYFHFVMKKKKKEFESLIIVSKLLKVLHQNFLLTDISHQSWLYTNWLANHLPYLPYVTDRPEQTVWTQMRCRILRHLIRVYTVCHSFSNF